MLSLIGVALKYIWGGICKFAYKFVSGLPGLPKATEAISTFNAITSVTNAINIFIPIDTIVELISMAIVTDLLFAFVAILRYAFKKNFLGKIISKINPIIGQIVSFIQNKLM